MNDEKLSEDISKDIKTVIETPETMSIDIDKEITKVLCMKTKNVQKRKPLSDEVKEQKRLSLQKAREAKTNKSLNKKEIETKFKEKVKVIENLDELIEKKVKEKIHEKIKKPIKDKTEKEKKKKELIETIVDEKLKDYKKPKKQESDFKLIQRFF